MSGPASPLVDRWLDSRQALRDAIEDSPPPSPAACWICGDAWGRRVPVPGMGVLVCAPGAGCQKEAVL
jgi:hypothetical protein